MDFDPAKLRKMASARERENMKFRSYLKMQDSEEVDQLAAEITEKVWKGIYCSACGNCCRVASPTLSQTDIDWLARHLGITNQEFIDKFLAPAEPDHENPWIIRDRPCPFLKDNRCTVHEHRPQDCRDYPYLHKPDLTCRTFSMIQRTSECPAAFQVWEELKSLTGFRRYRR